MALPASNKPEKKISQEQGAADKVNKKKKIWKKKKDLQSKPEESTVVKVVPAEKPKSDQNWKAFLEAQGSKGPERRSFTKSRPKNNLKRRKKPVNRTSTEELNIDTSQTEADIWFDDVDPSLLGIKKKDFDKKSDISKNNSSRKRDIKKIDSTSKTDSASSVDSASLNKTDTSPPTLTDMSSDLTKYLALDCEMVGVGSAGKESILARASLINSKGDCVYDKFVRPSEHVVDYRTDVSGVRARNLKDAPKYKVVQQEIADLLKGRILVGHAVQNDLKVLMLSHPRKHIRDTSRYKPFRKMLKTKRPALRKLAAEILKVSIQEGEHSSVVDARTTMQIFQKYKKEWEKSLHSKVSDNPETNGAKIFVSKDSANKTKKNKWTKIRQRKKARE